MQFVCALRRVTQIYELEENVVSNILVLFQDLRCYLILKGGGVTAPRP